MVLLTLALLCNAQTGLTVSIVVQSSFPREVSAQAHLPRRWSLSYAQSCWHEHRYMAAPWDPKHKSCWESGSPHLQCPPNAHNREDRHLL